MSSRLPATTSAQPDLTRRNFLSAFSFNCSLALWGGGEVLSAGEKKTGVLTPATMLSPQVVELAKHFEGLRLEAYRCPAGKLTIGFGHTSGVKPNDRLGSSEEAGLLLLKDMDIHRREVLSVLHDVALTQSQLDALTSASFNCNCLKGGRSGFARYLKENLPHLNQAQDSELKEKALHGIISYLCRYNRYDGKFADGLLRRRLSEGLLLAGAETAIVSPTEYHDIKAAVSERDAGKSVIPQARIPQMVTELLKRRAL